MSERTDRRGILGRFSRLAAVCAALVAAAVLTGGWILAAAPEAQPEPATASSEATSDLPDFVPSERLPADSAVAFPVDI
ncbi:MAG: hypothetical protein ACC742_04635 [Thermoanaerobaculales bacterium]